MNIEFAAIARDFSLDKGLINIEGACIEQFRATYLPSTFFGVVAGVAKLADADLGAQPEIVLEIKDPSGAVRSTTADVIRADRPPTRHGAPIREAFGIRFQFVARHPGLYVADLGTRQGPLVSLGFAVLDPVPDSPAGV